MNYRKLIDQVPLVSEIGFGAWQLGVNSGWKSMEEGDSESDGRKIKLVPVQGL